MTAASELPPGNAIVLRAGRDLRVCTEYHGQVRALLWLSLGRDGSLYTSFSAPRTQPGFSLIPEVVADGGSRFTWDRVEVDEQDPEREYVSFHASGVIYSRRSQSVGINLRLLTQRTFLCTYLPRHPSHWPFVKTTKARDLVVRDMLQDECPLTVELYYQPAGQLPLMASRLDRGRFVLPVGYADVERHERVLLHLVFCRQSGATAWAPSWVIAWPSLGNRAEPLQNEGWFEPGS